MIYQSRVLEKSLGNGEKIELNEKDSSIIQRRSIRAKYDLKKGSIIKRKDLTYLRPCQKALNHTKILKLLEKELQKIF